MTKNITTHPVIIDDHHNRVVLVPLAKGQGHAKINEDDFLRLRAEGFTGSWFLNFAGDGPKYVKLFYKTNNKSVAHLIMSQPKGYVVRYRNNDRTDLRRCNLVLQTRREQYKEIVDICSA